MAPVKRPKLDGFTEIIDNWLDGDKDAHRKQHHTAKRVLDRLRAEHGFTGGYTIIKDFVRERERRGQEMFVPLAHPPGQAKADFGEAIVVIGGVGQRAPCRVRWSVATAVRERTFFVWQVGTAASLWTILRQSLPLGCAPHGLSGSTRIVCGPKRLSTLREASQFRVLQVGLLVRPGDHA